MLALTTHFNTSYHDIVDVAPSTSTPSWCEIIMFLSFCHMIIEALIFNCPVLRNIQALIQRKIATTLHGHNYNSHRDCPQDQEEESSEDDDLEGGNFEACETSIFQCEGDHNTGPANDTRKNSSREFCCPDRRARFMMCKRRQRRRQRDICEDLHRHHQETSTSKGESGHCTVVAFYKLHLPPPLPFLRRKRSEAQGREQLYTENLQHQVYKDLELKIPNTTSTVNDVELSAESSCVERCERASDSEECSAISESTDSLVHTNESTTARSSLTDLARMQQWNTIIELARNGQINRKEAKHRDYHGLLPLHWASCGGPPLQAIKVLLELYPKAARKVDTEGTSALQFAAHYSASFEVIQALLDACPAAIQNQDLYGRSALYHAIDKQASLPVLRLLIDADPTMVTKPCHLPKPNRINRSLPKKLQEMPKINAEAALSRAEAVMTPLYLVWAIAMSESKGRNPRRKKDKLLMGKKWSKACIALDAAWRLHHPDLEEQGSALKTEKLNFSILHAAIILDKFLPECVVPTLIQTHREQLYMTDSISGQLPLTMMTRASSYSSARKSELIQTILAAVPPAVSHRDVYGRSALFWVASSPTRRSAEDVKLLIQAGPNALNWRDRTTGLPPALLAALLAKNFTTPLEDKDLLTRYATTTNAVDPFLLLRATHRDFLKKKTKLHTQTINDQVKCDGKESLGCIFELLKADPTQLFSYSTKSIG